MKRPENVSRYLWKNFLDFMGSGADFWTSEDGDLVGYCIVRTDEARNILSREFAHHDIAWSKVKLEEAYVDKQWVGHEFFDGGGTPAKIWTVVDRVTPYPVYWVDFLRNDARAGA